MAEKAVRLDVAVRHHMLAARVVVVGGAKAKTNRIRHSGNAKTDCMDRRALRDTTARGRDVGTYLWSSSRAVLAGRLR